MDTTQQKSREGGAKQHDALCVPLQTPPTNQNTRTRTAHTALGAWPTAHCQTQVHAKRKCIKAWDGTVPLGRRRVQVYRRQGGVLRCERGDDEERATALQ